MFNMYTNKMSLKTVKKTGIQNFLCQNCDKQFQAEYLYQRANSSIKPQLQSSLLQLLLEILKALIPLFVLKLPVCTEELSRFLKKLKY